MDLMARFVRFTLPAVLLTALVGCASKPPPPPPPTVLQVTINMLPNGNPDLNGNPKPVVFRFYELKSLAAFPTAERFALVEKDRDTLGAELVAREEYPLKPGSQLKFERKLDPDTRYIGAIADFQEVKQAQWRATMAVVPNRTSPVEIKLDASRVTITSP